MCVWMERSADCHTVFFQNLRASFPGARTLITKRSGSQLNGGQNERSQCQVLLSERNSSRFISSAACFLCIFNDELLFGLMIDFHRHDNNEPAVLNEQKQNDSGSLSNRSSSSSISSLPHCCGTGPTCPGIPA